MKRTLLICVSLFVSNGDGLGLFHRNRKYDIPPPPDTKVKSEFLNTTYFTQRLDHFNPTDEIFWNQKYFVSTEFFTANKSNVAFLLIGGEGEISEVWMSYGAWQVPAKKHGALLFQLEHRFYGESQPFSDLNVENLRYLSSDQALADIANFINGMNMEYNLTSDVKWIVFGGSYGGSLAAWARLKYPHLIHGAMSSSGPLVAKLEFAEYMQVVADDLAAIDQECVDAVRTAMDQVETLLTDPDSENITSLFNLCDNVQQDVESSLDIANFFQTITDVFAEVAQYNNIAGQSLTIDGLCTIMTNETLGKEIYRLVELNKLNLDNVEDCVDYKYDSGLEDARNISLLDGWARQWYYQTCTEYGWYQTTNQEVPIFGNRLTLDFYVNMCIDLYGQEFNETYISEQVRETNIDYGGLDIEASNVVFVHGSLDPWHAVGLTETRNLDSPVIFINGTAHCANLYEASDDDPPELTAAREEVDSLISVWLEGK